MSGQVDPGWMGRYGDRGLASRCWGYLEDGCVVSQVSKVTGKQKDV